MYTLYPIASYDIKLVFPRCVLAGRCSFRQYMPRKPGRYGLKLWVLCDARTSYCWRVKLYMGKPPGEAREVDVAKNVVLELSEGLRGHNITFDNFFTSFSLGQELLQRHLTMVGTVRRNRPELPPALLTTRGRRLHSSEFAFSQNTTLVTYIPKNNKNMLLMSTFHNKPNITQRQDRKLEIIIDYNKTKRGGGVDTMDQLISNYSCKRETARWPLALFSNILDISAHDGYIVWKELNPGWKARLKQRRRLFLQELGEALIGPTVPQQMHLPRGSHAATTVRAIRDAQISQAHPSDVQSTQSQPSAVPPPPEEKSKRKRVQPVPLFY
ncbi:piggyBac transposable element-derived protein 4-like [Brienomyrus brachyistius]|uniref:piggyBac transposable element-derived protein 4-like n=1 Tax=Brienomyrus brachyistius TaxID=42636 RepID=UPI0020B35A3A|nr:piggyBac transposable element-derived protein 4-like [Brienomyrus brachyistius]